MSDHEHDEITEDDYRHDERDEETGQFKPTPFDPPSDWTDATSVVSWYGSKIIQLISKATREKSLSKLRALSSAMDSWARLRRLADDSAEITNLRRELDQLREMIQSERGIRAVK